jgi:hypothetical protein
MRRLYRMTLERPEMDSQGQIARTRVSLTSFRLQELLRPPLREPGLIFNPGQHATGGYFFILFT